MDKLIVQKFDYTVAFSKAMLEMNASIDAVLKLQYEVLLESVKEKFEEYAKEVRELTNG